MDWAKTAARRDKKHLSFGIGVAYIGDLMVMASNILDNIGSCDGCSLVGAD